MKVNNNYIQSGESLLKINDGKIELGSFRYFPEGYEWRSDYIQPPQELIASVPVNESGYLSAYGVSQELDDWLNNDI
jgi:hypothetical protein